MARPVTLDREISPPPRGRKFSKAEKALSPKQLEAEDDDGLSLAAIEAGKIEIDDHLEYFSRKLASLCRNPRSDTSWRGIESYKELYLRNQHTSGRHFVVHQHDHPISGVHYDLRLQFSESSTISFAIPYGLPGNPNSIRSNRMAIETRVHCLWNNLIESASHATGSLLIWDTGEYEILPWKAEMKPMTDDEDSEGDAQATEDGQTHSEKLYAAFKNRHIRLRLQGTRLPQCYTIGLRLPSKNDRFGEPKRPKTKRKRLDPAQKMARSSQIMTDSDNEDDTVTGDADINTEVDHAGIASDNEEDIAIRENNAYSGAVNSIGSVHQRHWFLSLDRRRSGFTKSTKGDWVGPWEPFSVYGRDRERSVITGRSADEVMEDERVEKFVGRKMWRAILE